MGPELTRKGLLLCHEYIFHSFFVVVVVDSFTFTTCTLRNYFYIDMDPPHPMSFWHLLARLDMDIYPQNKCDGFPV